VFISGHRRRARPSVKNLAFSLVVSFAVVFLGWELFVGKLYEPLAAAGAIALLVTWFRFRGLRSGLPSPYGQGKTSVVDEKVAMRSGVLIVLGGILSVVGLMASVFLFPPEYYFVLLLGVIAGLPLSQVLFFALVSGVESKSRSKIFLLAEEKTKDEKTVLVKSIEMVPRAQS
jgi:hypothetical protein